MSSPLAVGLGVKVGKAARAQGMDRGAWPVRYRRIPDKMLAWQAAILDRMEGALILEPILPLGHPLSDRGCSRAPLAVIPTYSNLCHSLEDENVTPGSTAGPSGALLVPAGRAMVVDGPGTLAVGGGAVGGTTISGQMARSHATWSGVNGVAMFPCIQHYLSLTTLLRSGENRTQLA